MPVVPPPAAAARPRTRHGDGRSIAWSVEDVDGRQVVLVRSQPGRRHGALGSDDGRRLAEAATAASRYRLPLLLVLSSSGADVTDGVAALHGWGTAARAIAGCSGIVPVLAAVTGPLVSGPALLLGLADAVVFTDDARAWVTGPRGVAEVTGVEIAPDALGGAAAHATRSGVAALLASDEAGAFDALRDLLSYLPSHVDEAPPLAATADPWQRPTPELRAAIPDAATGSYDVRDVVGAIADDGEVLELRARWAPNLVTALGRVAGRPVGFVANQPQALAGTLDIPAAQKGARFVRFCDAFGVPLVTLVDTPGFFPGKDLEWRGMIRHGAQLVHAYADATVPRVAVVLRKAYGGAYIVMDCKTMGNDVCLAWPSAEIAVMGAKGAVAILHRGASTEEAAAHEAAYEAAHLTPWTAAGRGLVDAVIDPAETRRAVAGALLALEHKREALVRRAHANEPL